MDASLPRSLSTPFFRAWLKITEGCDNQCSYCLIPSIRGRLRSRDIEDLVVESQNLEKKGVKELTMVAQDLTAYGDDLPGSTLVQLLQGLLDATSIPWIRLMCICIHLVFQKNFFVLPQGVRGFCRIWISRFSM